MTDDLAAVPARDAASVISYEEWSERLATHFFKPEFAGEPVMFFIDDDVIAGVRDCGAPEAVADLVASVIGKLSRSQPKRLFGGIERATRTWKLGGGEGVPPCLPLLALTVLAASRMRRSRSYAANNYYDRFIDLLGAPFSRAEIHASYVESLPYCWRVLEWWLDERHDGRLGYSTIAEDPHFTNIGFADSQTLFSTSDQSKLSRFFEWIDLVPGEPTGESELLASFKVWSAGRTDLSVGAQFMVSSETHVAQLGRILTSAARRWTGVVKASDGRDEAHILVLLEPFPAVRLTLAAERLEGFPKDARYRAASGNPIELTSSQPGWYDDVPLDVTGGVLRRGVRLVSDRHALSLSGADIHLLRKHEELGWASAKDMTPATQHWLLVAEPQWEAVETYLRRVARPEWERIQSPAIPQGWGAFRNVVIDAIDHLAAPHGLDRLVPTLRRRVSLSGGLPLSRSMHVYLSGGEPDLWLPSAGETSLDIRLDGTPVEAPADSIRIRLAERALSVGTHRIDLGPAPVSFSTLRTLGRIQPALEGCVAHVLMPNGRAFEPATLEAQAVTGSPSPGTVWIIGAATIGRDEDVPLSEARPVVLPSGAQRRVLLGARPGEVEEVSKPAKPPWMDDAQLGTRVFEHVPSFDVAWVITDWWHAPSKTRAALPLAPLSPRGPLDPTKLVAWRNAIISAPKPSDERDRARWQEYVRASADKFSSAERVVAAPVPSRGGNESTPLRATAKPDNAPRTSPHPSRSHAVRLSLALQREEQAATERRRRSAMHWDLLLEWVSELGSGSFGGFREACNWTFETVEPGSWIPTAGQAARRLATLGHIEIDWITRRWVAAPTTITLLPSAGAHALVTGSRTRALKAPLEDALADEDMPLFEIRHAQQDGPTAVFIACEAEGDLEWLAQALGIRFEHSVSERLVRLLPPLDSYLPKAKAAPAPPRYGVESFEATTLRWRMASADTAPGLYRYDLPGGRAYRLIDRDGSIYALDSAKATYAALSRWGPNVLKYMSDSVNGTLVVPLAAPLPVLQARAAALCSGLAPLLQGKTQWYRNVPGSLAQRIAWSLDQALVELP
jgi:hypothetical protein